MNRKLLFVIINCAFALLTIFLIAGQTKIDLRFALFSENTLDINDFKKKPEELKTSLPDFLHFKQKYIDAVISTNEIEKFNFADSISFVERVKKITLTYSKNGGPGCGTNSDDLIKNIRWLSQDTGHGCCSDHSQAFIALCLVNNIFAREVHHKSHTFNEYYDPNLSKWVWIDSQTCMMAKDTQGNYLGLSEIYTTFKNKDSVTWHFFGTPNHRLYNTQNYGKALYYFTSNEFELLTMTLGNNVFEVNYYNQKYAWLPKEIRQFGLLLFNIQPKYLFYDPNSLVTKKFQKLKYTFWTSVTLFFLFNLWILMPSLKYRSAKFLKR